MNRWASVLTFKMERKKFYSQDSCGYKMKEPAQVHVGACKAIDIVMAAWAISLFLQTWLGLIWSLMRWFICVLCIAEDHPLPRHREKLILKLDTVIPIVKPWNLQVRMCPPTFIYGVCHSEFSSEAALCRFLVEFQRKGAANKHKYNFAVIITLPIIIKLKEFPPHFYTEISWLKHIKDLWKQSAALAIPEI